jgi:hypothetical protein
MSAPKTGTSTGQDTETGPTENLTLSVQDGLATAMKFPTKIMEANFDTGAELLTFISRRMKAQADLFSGVGHSHDMTEAADMQRTFWDKVTQDYADEMKHLAAIIHRNFQAAAGPIAPLANGDADQRRAM